MKNNDIYTNKGFLKQIQSVQKIANVVNTPAIQEALSIVNSPAVQQAYQSVSVASSAMESVHPVLEQASILYEFANNNIKGILSSNIEHYTSLAQIATDAVQSFPYERLSAYMGAFANYKLAHCYPDNIPDEEIAENKKIDNKIVTEIFSSNEDTDKTVEKKESAIITLSPVNDMVLKYLSENELFYGKCTYIRYSRCSNNCL